MANARSLAKLYALDQLHAEPVGYEQGLAIITEALLKSTIQTIFIGLTDSAFSARPEWAQISGVAVSLGEEFRPAEVCVG